MAAFVLAGGASTRMGTDKALLRFNGKTLVERALDLLRSVGLAPEIVGSREDLCEYAPVVADLRAGCGPLSGIEAGLQKACLKKTKALFIPVDAPFLSPGLLQQMLERVWLSGALATIPRSLGQEQPLCAIYDCRLLPVISLALDAGDNKVMRVIQQNPLTLADPAAVDCYDTEIIFAANGNQAPWLRSAHRIFHNCNTPDELKTAESWLRSEGVQ